MTPSLRWRARGTHTVEFMGIPATNIEIDIPVCEIYEFSDEGEVTQTWMYSDPLALPKQLGVNVQVG